MCLKMDRISELFTRYKTAVTCSIVGLTSAVVLVKYLRRPKPRKCGVDYPENVVMVYGARGKTGPNMGHFVMKLETYLRVNQIPYKSLKRNRASAPKGKIPYIEYNSVTMGDSQLIMEYLNTELGVDLNDHLSKKEAATAWAIQKWLEEFTYFLNVHSRWVIHFDEMFDSYQNVIPWYVKRFMGRAMRKRSVIIGVGRHTDEEIGRMIEKDLRCFSTILDGELKNVSDYLDRIRTQYWPDWDDPSTGK